MYATTYPVMAIDYVAGRTETIKIYPKFKITQITGQRPCIILDAVDLNRYARLSSPGNIARG